MHEEETSHDVEVVVTGIGCVCPTLSAEQRQRLLPGVDSGWIEPSDLFPENKSLRLLSRDGTLAVIAARRAMLDAGLRLYDSPQPDPTRVGLFGATGMMSFPEADLARLTSYSIDSEGRFDSLRMGAEALRRTRPILSFKLLGNMPICFVSIFENIQGPGIVYAPTEEQGGRAMTAGFQAILRGEVDIALVGATDSKASRFDRTSMTPPPEHGLIDEAAAFLVFERKESAEKRGAKILASLVPSYENSPEYSPQAEIGTTVPISDIAPLKNAEQARRLTSVEQATGLTRFCVPFAATLPLRAVMNLATGLQTPLVPSCTNSPTYSPQAEIGTTVPILDLAPLKSAERVVVTGLGVATPLGCTVETFWRSLLAGDSAIETVSHFDASTFQTTVAAEITDKTSAWDEARLRSDWSELGLQNVRDRKVLFALDAASQAILHSGLDATALADAALCLGVGLESIPMQDLIDLIAAKQDDPISGGKIHAIHAREPASLASQLLGDRFGFHAGRYTNVSACAAGAMAIGEAYRLIQSGEVSLAVCGGSDSMVNPLGLGGFGLLGVLSAGSETRPPGCRPFHSKRDGTLIGEGAAMMLLESEASARRRGATILGEVVGFASTLDAKSVTDPALDGQGIARCMKNAIADAGSKPDAIDTINAHATGTVTGDQVEAESIQKLFGDRRPLPVSAIKAQIGHAIGASGAIEAVVSILTLRDQIVPQTVGLDDIDARCKLDHVTGGPRRMAIHTVLSNSFGLGGQNASLVFKEFITPARKFEPKTF